MKLVTMVNPSLSANAEGFTLVAPASRRCKAGETPAPQRHRRDAGATRGQFILRLHLVVNPPSERVGQPADYGAMAAEPSQVLERMSSVAPSGGVTREK